MLQLPNILRTWWQLGSIITPFSHSPMEWLYLCQMKNNLILLTLSVFLMFSCKRDEKQIMETWHVEKVTIGGVDQTAAYKLNNYTEVYAENGAYSFSGDPQNNSGSGKYTWEGKTIKRNGVSNQTSMDLSVTSVTKTELEYNTTINGEAASFEFKK